MFRILWSYANLGWDYLVLNGTNVFTSSTKRFHLIPITGHGRNYMDVTVELMKSQKILINSI